MPRPGEFSLLDRFQNSNNLQAATVPSGCDPGRRRRHRPKSYDSKCQAGGPPSRNGPDLNHSSSTLYERTNHVRKP